MRRTFATAVAVLGLAVPFLPAGTSAASGDPVLVPAPSKTSAPPTVPTAPETLERATDALDGDATEETRPEATLALRDLFTALPRLTGTDRRRAESLLARPTQRGNDPYGDGYRAPATRRCSAKLCVHRVKRTSDQASAAWARRTLKVLGRVWKKEIGGMGYRRPLRDGSRGGNGKFDVYLADVGAEGLYGYCAPELTAPGNDRLASGYCVLDNDFARSQFRARPGTSLTVTAAHEFFHAIQFAYDYREDPWLMEATATWIEERVADGANDNRQYLRYGQVRTTWEPLDRFDPARRSQYGNWAFVEYLSQRFGNGLVKDVWRRAGHHPRGSGRYSTRALVEALPKGLPFARVYADFQAANVLPARAYPEGEHWPRPRLAADRRLGANQGVDVKASVDHLAGLDFRMRPKAALDTRKWRLRVRVDGPASRTSPRVTLVRLTAGDDVRRTRVPLDDDGVGKGVVAFNQKQTKAVWIAVSNASTRFRCRGRYVLGYSCGGRPRDDDRAFDLRLKTFTKG